MPPACITPQGTSFLLVRYLSGFYVFGYSGQDVATSGRLAEVGEFGFDPSGAFYKGGIADSNDAGTVNSLTLDGSLAEFDIAGRSLATLTVTVGGVPHVEHYALYVSWFPDNFPPKMYAVSIDPVNSSGHLLSGPVLSQSPSGDADNTFLQGILVLQAAGLNVSGGQSSGVAAAGLATFDGTGNITKLDVEQNVGGTFNFYNGAGTYSVSSNGRTTLAAQGLPSIAYVASPNEMFAISTDASATLAYFEWQQSSEPFSNASLSGYYSAGSLPPVKANVTNSVLQLTADGNGNLTGVGDNSGPNGLQSNVNFAGTYSLDATGKSPLSGSISGYMYLGGYDMYMPEFIVVTNENNPRVLTILGY